MLRSGNIPNCQQVTDANAVRDTVWASETIPRHSNWNIATTLVYRRLRLLADTCNKCVTFYSLAGAIDRTNFLANISHSYIMIWLLFQLYCQLLWLSTLHRMLPRYVAMIESAYVSRTTSSNLLEPSSWHLGCHKSLSSLLTLDSHDPSSWI